MEPAGTTDGQDELVQALTAAVPPGRPHLSAADITALMGPTQALIRHRADAGRAEYRRFRDLRDRAITVDPRRSLAAHRGRTVLVTGGTGCIGSALLEQLQQWRPERLVSLSRGVSAPARRVAGVEYRSVDVRDREAVAAVVRELRPQLVYHLAAQHDPSLAEREVARTLSTNVTGTANVLDACRRYGVPLVHASTGKAMRPYSNDVYAASKKLAEWLLASAARSGQVVTGAARFTHVVDNSIICRRLTGWARDRMPVRLHSPDVSFYLQSALEAAQLLVAVGLEAVRGHQRLAAIRDLGWPISLMDLAVGLLAETGSPTAIYLCGFEAGYERRPYPGLYDPRTSGDRSPLFNAWEAAMTTDAEHCPDVDVCPVPAVQDNGPQPFIDAVARLAAADADPDVLRDALDSASWSVLSSSVRSLPTDLLRRHVALVERLPHTLFGPDDRTVVGTVRQELTRRRADRIPDALSTRPSAAAMAS
ncbi:NAD-dependent epimerase/dehydratase family protein [Nakamurella endophytica]|uniref:Ketoreductase domain-containing protein n=1 Tax=Nakamurella endophytica TaxID=1748367 RepID=A0A917SP06_9ACTN|nr:NAD-dependent epimerase/dehydratase family protein [Nakamurella endophytica]GGL91384.1 hypothetical protein GCM10011594_08940 [Nakamurella endophytica]